MKINFTKNKIIAVSFAIAICWAGLLLPGNAKAAVPLDVQFEKIPLFFEANFTPGEGVERWVKVANNSGQTQRIAVEAINYPNPIPAGDLSRALMFVIKEGATDLYGGSSPTGLKTLFDFYQDSANYQEQQHNTILWFLFRQRKKTDGRLLPPLLIF